MSTFEVKGIPLPGAYVERMQRLLSEEADAFFHAVCDEERVRGLRVNPFKGLNVEEAYELLCSEGFRLTPLSDLPSGFILSGKEDAGKHPFHAAGLFYLQDVSAMVPVSLLRPVPGERVLDLCAAPGGKSTQIAAALNGEGLLVADEVIPKRAAVLSENIERMGIANAVVLNEKTARIAHAFPQYFDAVLVDAPCSGEGMFRKNPEAIKEWSREAVLQCAARQDEILDDADACLRNGGRLVYSTCTFSSEENEERIAAFLLRHPAYRLAASRRMYPHECDGEGQFAALLIKGAEAMRGSVEGAFGRKKETQTVPDKAYTGFLHTTLTKEGIARMKAFTLFRMKDRLYGIPSGMPSVRGLHVLRQGLQLGTFVKDRFLPAHALAAFLRPADVIRVTDLNLSDEAATAYLRGLSLPANGSGIRTSGETGNGFALVTVNGISLGWGKRVNDTIKNHYPKALRIP